MRNAIFAFLLAISLASAFNVSDCTGAGGGNYTVVSDTSYTSVPNGAASMGSPNFAGIATIGSTFGDASSGGLQTQFGSLSATPPYIIQFDFLNMAGTAFDINFTSTDMDGVILINQTTISTTSGVCTPTSSAIVNQTYNIEYHCTGVAQNSSVTVSVSNSLGLTSRATRSITSYNEGYHCFYGVTPIPLGSSTAMLTVIYTADPGAHASATLNGHLLGNLTGSGSDIFTGIPIAWLSNTSIADYVAATPAGSNSTVVITSSTLSYYSGLVYYPNYTTDFTAGTVTTQSNGSFYATYGHSSEFDSFIVAISGLFPLLVAVAVLLLVWRIGVYWEKTGT
jgi:hypothetical protein